MNRYKVIKRQIKGLENMLLGDLKIAGSIRPEWFHIRDRVKKELEYMKKVNEALWKPEGKDETDLLP